MNDICDSERSVEGAKELTADILIKYSMLEDFMSKDGSQTHE